MLDAARDFLGFALNSKAAILIGLARHEDLAGDYDNYSWFMGASRAGQLRSVVEAV